MHHKENTACKKDSIKSIMIREKNEYFRTGEAKKRIYNWNSDIIVGNLPIHGSYAVCASISG